MSTRGLSVSFSDLRYEVLETPARQAGLLAGFWARFRQRQPILSDIEAQGEAIEAGDNVDGERNASDTGDDSDNQGKNEKLKQILKGVSGEVLPGEAMAIVSAYKYGDGDCCTL